MDRILCIDDSEEIQILVRHALSGCDVTSALSLREAERLLTDHLFDLALVDVSLPDGDGIHAIMGGLSPLRDRKIPFIFLTSQSDIAKKVTAFALGADDFVVKPFDSIELRSRVMVRIEKQRQLRESILRVGDLVIDVSRQRVKIQTSKKSLEVELTSLEFRILLLLAQRIDHVLSRSRILDSVWGDSVNITDRTVDTHVAHLRKKIIKSSVQIVTVQNEGYKLRPKSGL